MKRYKIGLLFPAYLLLMGTGNADFLSYGFPTSAPNTDWPTGNWIGGVYASDISTLSEEEREIYNDSPSYVQDAGCVRLGENYRLPSIIDFDRGRLLSVDNWYSTLSYYGISYPYDLTGPYFHSSAYQDKNVFGDLLYNPMDYKKPNSNVPFVRKVGALNNEWGLFTLYSSEFTDNSPIGLSELVYIFGSTGKPNKYPPYPGDSNDMSRATFSVYNGKLDYVSQIPSTVAGIKPSFSVYCIKEIE